MAGVTGGDSVKGVHTKFMEVVSGVLGTDVGSAHKQDINTRQTFVTVYLHTQTLVSEEIPTNQLLLPLVWTKVLATMQT